MPAIPIADSSAPIVVGISATSSAISVVTETVVLANSAYGRSATITSRKISVSAASRMLSAISSASCAANGALDKRDHASKNECPGSWVISTTSLSESTRVPP